MPYDLSDIIGTCHPNQERHLIFKLFNAIAKSAEVTCSPVDTTTSYSEYEGLSEVLFTKSIKLLVKEGLHDIELSGGKYEINQIRKLKKQNGKELKLLHK